MKWTACIVTAGLLAVLCGSVFAQSPQAATKSGLSTLDKAYLKDTAQSNLEEVQLEPIVLSHATNNQDKEFGRRMKKDHAKANKDLKRLPSKLGNDLPKNISEDQTAVIKRLSSMHGAKFDAAYKQEMIRDHTEDIAKTKREISLGQDPQVKASAQKNLALLQMHLKMAQSLPGGSSQQTARKM